MVPHPHYVHLIRLVKNILDPGAVRLLRTEPHVVELLRMFAADQSGTIDGLAGIRIFAVHARGCCIDEMTGKRDSNRFHRKAPHIALPRAIGLEIVDLINTPVISLPQVQSF